MRLAPQYAAKLVGNMVGLLAGLVLLSLGPRILGPAAYGRYEFLTNFFLQVKSLLDMGTSTCFYTRLFAAAGRYRSGRVLLQAVAVGLGVDDRRRTAASRH